MGKYGDASHTSSKTKGAGDTPPGVGDTPPSLLFVLLRPVPRRVPQNLFTMN